jgi:hypothetical protein
MGHDAGVGKTHLPIHRTVNRVGSPIGGWSESGSSTHTKKADIDEQIDEIVSCQGYNQ